jgi:hypothetical protein
VEKQRLFAGFLHMSLDIEKLEVERRISSRHTPQATA